ncbi:MAG: helix-turn-helix transcriptional regulator [Clostridia bacterium]|nr:helix-turn-helix transcriptional regulator [Clostridia bacterium]
MITEKQIFCGFFDSEQHTKNRIKTDVRTVLDYEIELFDADGGISFIDGRSYPVKRGMLLLVKPGQKRCTALPVRCRYIRIYPHEDIPRALTEILDALPECVYSESEQEMKALLRQFEKFGRIFLHKTPAPDPFMLNALFYGVLYQCKKLAISTESAKATTAHSKIAADVQAYLDMHFHENCALHILSREIHASPNHIRIAFQVEYGVSPYEYVLQKRIEQAKILIAEQRTSFTDIAIQLGFCSQSHFNKLFKARVHCTPKEYQEEAFKLYFNGL